jgi:hypothetical protein
MCNINETLKPDGNFSRHCFEKKKSAKKTSPRFASPMLCYLVKSKAGSESAATAIGEYVGPPGTISSPVAGGPLTKSSGITPLLSIGLSMLISSSSSTVSPLPSIASDSGAETGRIARSSKDSEGSKEVVSRNCGAGGCDFEGRTKANESSSSTRKIKSVAEFLWC